MSDPQEQRELQEVRARIGFGMDVETFMKSPIGRHLTRRANETIFAAHDELAEVDAEDPKAIRTLQNKITAARYFLEWLDEAVTAGEQAERTFIDAEGQQG